MIQIERSIVQQILGTLMQKPLYLSDTDKFRLDPNDFPNRLDKFIFSAIYNLYLGGAELIHTVDIDLYLKENPLAKETMEKENGIQFLQDCEAYAEPQNFTYYYNKLKKFNLLRDLQKSGQDTSKIYCEDSLDDDYLKINNEFERLTTTDIVNKLKGNLASLENTYCFNQTVEECCAADGIFELLQELKEKPEIGIKLQGDIFNTITRGGRKGTLFLRSAPSSFGKAIPDYIKIPTPDGWKRVDEIQVGDYLFDRFGKPTKVLGVFPQEEKKQVYKVFFKSGRVAECCNEHLWSYYSNGNDKHPDRLITKTLQEIIDNPKGLRDKGGSYRWSIPICQPVNFPTKKYSVDPYVMGLILGDGSFRYTKRQKAFYFSSQDEELVSAIKERMGYKLYKKNKGENYTWTFELNNSEHKNVWVEDILKDYSELWQAKSEDKFIPQEYLFGDVEQRFEILRGLLDTDGTIDLKGRISFSTISEKLKDDIVTLCESLGMACSVTLDKRTEKYTTGLCYIISIHTSKENKLKMFRLSRKIEIALNYFNNKKRVNRQDRDSIIKIEKTDKYTNMTCFYVDNPEHLFLINNFICTHNTRLMIGDACQIAYPIRFEPTLGRWVSTGKTEPVLYIMTEQDPKEIQTMILAYLTGFNEEVFKYGTFDSPEHMTIINKALEIMEKYKNNLLFARIPDPCASVVKNLFRRYNLQKGVENFFFDYIFSSPAMLEEYRDLKLPEHVCLRLFTTALKNLAIELNSFVMTATQISEQENDKKNSWKDYHNIAGARAIVHLVDFGCIVSRPTQEELKQIEGFSKLYNLTPNFVVDVFKNRGGRWTMLRIWAVHDLGTCRRCDLFVTTPDLKPIDDFQIVDFIEEKDQEQIDLENYFNEGQIPLDVSLELLENVASRAEDIDLREEVEEAFGDLISQRERVKSKGFDDLL